MTYAERIAPYESALARLTADAWTRLWKAGGARLFLAYRPSGPDTWGELLVMGEMDDLPDGVSLATPEAIPSHLTRELLARWFRRVCDRLPLFPTEVT